MHQTWQIRPVWNTQSVALIKVFWWEKSKMTTAMLEMLDGGRFLFSIWVLMYQQSKSVLIFVVHGFSLKNIKFSRNCTKFYILTKIAIFKYNWNSLDQLLPPYKSQGSGLRGILFFHILPFVSLKECWKTKY